MLRGIWRLRQEEGEPKVMFGGEDDICVWLNGPVEMMRQLLSGRRLQINRGLKGSKEESPDGSIWLADSEKSNMLFELIRGVCARKKGVQGPLPAVLVVPTTPRPGPVLLHSNLCPKPSFEIPNTAVNARYAYHPSRPC